MGREKPSLVASLLAAELEARVYPQTSTLNVQAHHRAGKDAFLAIVPIFDMTRPAIERAVRSLARRAIVEPGFTPIIFTSLDVFEMARPHGWVVEHVMPEADWCRYMQREDWTSYLLQRFKSVLATYGVQGACIPDLVGGFEPSSGMQAYEGFGRATDKSVPTDEVAGWRAWSHLAKADVQTKIRVDLGHGITALVVSQRASFPLTLVEYTDWALDTTLDYARRANERGWSTVTIWNGGHNPVSARAASEAIHHAFPSLAFVACHPSSMEAPRGFDFAVAVDGSGSGRIRSPYGEASIKSANLERFLAGVESFALGQGA